MTFLNVLPYIILMAAVTYFVRMIPLVFIRKKITNRFLLSLLYYLPYTVLSAMTFPAILYATGDMRSAAAGFIVAFLLAYKRKSLVTVALSACAVSFLTELLIRFVFI